jgi:tetratricopeptide (TPR) repeat protein
MSKSRTKQKQIKSNNSLAQKHKWKIGGLVLFLITFILFSPTLNYDFVNWDDDVNVYENESIQELDKEHVKAIFTNSVIGGYNPLTSLTFAIEYHLVGEEARLFHRNNNILHALCTILVFILFHRLGLSFFSSFLIALLFGIHPMRIESVAWITERKDVLFGAFFLSSLILYVRYIKEKKLLYFLLSILVFVLSLLSKIQAVSLPFVLLLIDYWFKRDLNKKLILEKVPFFALALVTGIVGIYFLKQQEALDVGNTYPLVQRLFIGSYSFMVYIVKSIFPYEMSALYPYVTEITGIYYLSMIPALFIVVYSLLTWKSHRTLFFGFFFFVFNIVFLLQIVGAGQGFLADRFTYIPYIGLFFIYVVFVERLLAKNKTNKTMVYLPLVAYLLFLTVKTSSQIKVWENSETLWTNVIKEYPHASLAYNNLGRYYRTQNEPDKALLNYNSALENDPEYGMCYNNRGRIYFDKGQVDLAIEDYKKAIEFDYINSEVYSNLGAAYGMKQNQEAALINLNKALELNPQNTSALSNRGYLYFLSQDYHKTIEDYQIILQYKRNDADIINTIGLCYNRLNDYDKAIEMFNRSISINPNNGIFYINRSIALNAKGNKQAALVDAQMAVRLGVNVNQDYLDSLQ